MRRVTHVRVVVEPDRVRAEAVGVGHRMPVTRPIPVATALELARSGVPMVHRRSPATGEDVER
jgi:hypothetical protein